MVARINESLFFRDECVLRLLKVAGYPDIAAHNF
jgi:hypothetical protein